MYTFFWKKNVIIFKMEEMISFFSDTRLLKIVEISKKKQFYFLIPTKKPNNRSIFILIILKLWCILDEFSFIFKPIFSNLLIFWQKMTFSTSMDFCFHSWNTETNSEINKMLENFKTEIDEIVVLKKTILRFICVCFLILLRKKIEKKLKTLRNKNTNCIFKKSTFFYYYYLQFYFFSDI